MAIIGIDLGTTNSLAAVFAEGGVRLIPNVFGEYLTPSVVGLSDEGEILVGKLAKERLVSHPEKTVSSFKRFMGSEKTYRLGERSFTPEELSALVLKSLKADAEAFLGEEVTEAVISVPAYFDDNGRSATRAAGRLAGLKTERLVNEPSAAALSVYDPERNNRGSFLVVDLGGGTLDVSVVEIFHGVIDVLSIAGDNRLGGDDFNAAIAGYFCRENQISREELSSAEWAAILRQAEMCKIALSSQKSAAMLFCREGKEPASLRLDNQRLVDIAAGLFKRIERPIRRALRDSGYEAAGGTGKVLVVGGAGRMPSVRKYVAYVTGKTPVRLKSPDTAVVRGAALAAALKEGRKELDDVVLTDVCPFSLGVDLVNHENPGDLLFSPVIERNTTLPVSIVKEFVTAHEEQRKIQIGIYQGESLYCRENLKLGELSLEMPQEQKGRVPVLVRFTYDINGILDVELSVGEGNKAHKVILNPRLQLSGEELNSRIKALEAIKTAPRSREENRLVLARAERLYEENTGSRRSAIASMIQRFEAALATRDERKIRVARETLKEFLPLMELGEGETDPGELFKEEEDGPVE